MSPSIRPSPLLASVRPNLQFDPAEYVAFDDVFVARVMEPTDACVAAMIEGVGMPDRADRGWIELSSAEHVEDAVSEHATYSYEGRRFVDIDRRQRHEITQRLARTVDGEVHDRTEAFGRVAVTGPHSRRLLEAIGLAGDALAEPGAMERVEVLEEPVWIARSDFAGPQGYDLVIPIEMFNAVLAVICSWAVRLELNLLPCGLEAVERVRSRFGVA